MNDCSLHQSTVFAAERRWCPVAEIKQPYKIDMYPMLSGKCDRIDISFSLQPEPVAELAIVFYKPFEVHGEVTNKSGYINLRLCAEVPFDTVCARCLKTIRKVQSVSLDKTVAVKGTLEDENADEVVDDYLLIEDGFLDVASPVLEQLMLSLPIKSLCKEDCAGLCPRCGRDLNEGKCDCPEHEPDPRLACLAALLEDGEDDKEQE